MRKARSGSRDPRSDDDLAPAAWHSSSAPPAATHDDVAAPIATPTKSQRPDGVSAGASSQLAAVSGRVGATTTRSTRTTMVSGSGGGPFGAFAEQPTGPRHASAAMRAVALPCFSDPNLEKKAMTRSVRRTTRLGLRLT